MQDTQAAQSDIDLLRRRLGQVGAAGVVMGGFALIFQVPPLLQGILAPWLLACHLAGIAASLGGWIAARKFKLGTRGLRVTDFTMTLASTLAYGGMGTFAACLRPEPNAIVALYTVQLVATYVVALRAALLPSTTRWTAFVTLVAFVGMVPVVSYVVTLGTLRAGEVIFGAVMWWTITVILTSITSSVNYGLRQDVKAARSFGQYQLVEKIGEGGMGAVYRARHHMLRRDTALKVLLPGHHSAKAIARFEREVRLTARLSHPNTVTVFDYGRTPDGCFYYTMELLEGATLEEIVQATGPMPPERAARVLFQVAGALAEAHELGLIHRDVKPSNIMLCARGGELDVAKVLDFGLVRESASLSESMATEIVGTPLYVPPEAISAPSQVTEAGDLYSLGAVAVFLLTGRPPFVARTLVEVCAHHLHSAPPVLGEPVPEPMRALVAACLAKSPAERPASARAVRDMLSPLAARWSEADARAFWAANAEAIRAQTRPVAAVDALGETLEIDVARRLSSEDPSGRLRGPAEGSGTRERTSSAVLRVG